MTLRARVGFCCYCNTLLLGEEPPAALPVDTLRRTVTLPCCKIYNILQHILDFYSEAPSGPQMAAANRPVRQTRPNGPPAGPLEVSGPTRPVSGHAGWTTDFGCGHEGPLGLKWRDLADAGVRHGRARRRRCSSTRQAEHIGKPRRGARRPQRRRLEQQMHARRGRRTEEAKEPNSCRAATARCPHTRARGS